jgi:hypothetical protein
MVWARQLTERWDRKLIAKLVQARRVRADLETALQGHRPSGIVAGSARRAGRLNGLRHFGNEEGGQGSRRLYDRARNPVSFLAA